MGIFLLLERHMHCKINGLNGVTKIVSASVLEEGIFGPLHKLSFVFAAFSFMLSGISYIFCDYH